MLYLAKTEPASFTQKTMKIHFGKPGRKNRANHVDIDDWDIWSLDHTLARIIHPALIRLKEKQHGYPELWEDGMCYHECYTRQLHFDFIDEDVESKYLQDKWNRILDDMIYAMDIIATEKIYDIDFDTYDNERVDRGLELFGKHFCSLWD